MVTWADAVEIDGIYYNLISKVKTAEVTSNPNKYTGTVVIPESVTYEGEKYDVKTIGYSAFFYCSSLISVTIPSSILTIKQAAFQSCSNLTSFTIPNSVTNIEGWTFSRCSRLTSITIPNSVLTIGENAFAGCTSLDSITIPNSITGIASHMFDGCTGLTSITIPNSVTSIGSYAFNGCTGLTSITIPNSVTSTGEHVFSGCTGLTSVTIPNSITSISSCAFSGCSNLSSVTIPNSVRYIESGAFEMCSALTTVSIGSGVKNIYSYAFYLCPELTNVFCYAESVPRTDNDIFKDSYIEYATLHVPEQSINSYQLTEPWVYFKNIIKLDILKYALTYMIDGEVYKTYEIEEGEAITPEPAPTKEGYTFSGWSEIPETMPAHDVTVTGYFTQSAVERCATPTIAYNNGKLSFYCDTEGATFSYRISIPTSFESEGEEVNLPTQYAITVIAKKDGYLDSDPVTQEIDVRGLTGDMNGDGKISITDAVTIVNTILGVSQESQNP